MFGTKLLPSCRYHLLQLLFSIVLFNGDLAISFKSFVELVSDVPFHAVCSTVITDTADMSPTSEITKGLQTCQRAIPEENSGGKKVTSERRKKKHGVGQLVFHMFLKNNKKMSISLSSGVTILGI